jgi:hypothetical protein
MKEGVDNLNCCEVRFQFLHKLIYKKTQWYIRIRKLYFDSAHNKTVQHKL